MNYYLVQTQFFLVFIIISCLSLSALPYIDKSFSSLRDMKIQSQFKQIQGEMFFVSNYDHACYEGPIGGLVTDLYRSSRYQVSCRTTQEDSSKIMICSLLEKGTFQCIDGKAVMCELSYPPLTEFSCKESHLG